MFLLWSYHREKNFDAFEGKFDLLNDFDGNEVLSSTFHAQTSVFLLNRISSRIFLDRPSLFGVSELQSPKVQSESHLAVECFEFIEFLKTDHFKHDSLEDSNRLASKFRGRF